MQRYYKSFILPIALAVTLGSLGLMLAATRSTADDGTKQTSASAPVPTAGDHIPAEPAPNTIVDQLQATYQKIRTYRTMFTQETESTILHTSRSSSGRIIFKKPGKMRWTYESPRVQEIFLLPDRIYIYLPEQRQVITSAPGEYLAGVTPTKFLMGMGNLKEDFTVSLIQDTKPADTVYHLRLVPKESKSQITSIDLWVRSKDFIIDATESVDVMGNRTVVRFSRQEINPDLPESLFSFEIPKDAEIITDGLSH